MILTIVCLLVFGSFVLTLVSMAGKCPLTVPVLLLAIAELLHCLPLR